MVHSSDDDVDDDADDDDDDDDDEDNDDDNGDIQSKTMIIMNKQHIERIALKKAKNWRFLRERFI